MQSCVFGIGTKPHSCTSASHVTSKLRPAIGCLHTSSIHRNTEQHREHSSVATETDGCPPTSLCIRAVPGSMQLGRRTALAGSCERNWLHREPWLILSLPGQARIQMSLRMRGTGHTHIASKEHAAGTRGLAILQMLPACVFSQKVCTSAKTPREPLLLSVMHQIGGTAKPRGRLTSPYPSPSGCGMLSSVAQRKL